MYIDCVQFFYIIFSVFISLLKLVRLLNYTLDNFNSLQESCICLNAKTLFSTWRLLLNCWKLLFWSHDLCLHAILHLLSKFCTSRPKWRRNTEEHFQSGVQPPSWICKILIFLSNDHPRNGNSHLHTKFNQNWMIRGWDMEKKLFSKWRPSAILNFRKLPFWSRDLYLHIILHLCSKCRINLPIWCRGIGKRAIFNMAPDRHLEFAKFPFFVKYPSSEWKLASAYQIWSR